MMKSLLVFGYILTECLLYGQPAEFLFDHYGPAQGLHSSEIFDIIQSYDHFLWLATDEGLVRYDGHTFKYYIHDPEDTTTLSNDYVERLSEDKHGRIWIAASTSVNVYDPKKNQFSRLKARVSGTDITAINPTSFVYNPNGDTMWISSDAGLFYNTSSQLNLQELTIKGLNDNQCSGHLTLDKQNNLLLSTAYGTYLITSSGSIVETIHSPGYISATTPIEEHTYHYEDDTGTIWIGTWTKGLYKFSPGGQFNKHVYAEAGQNAIYSICETKHIPDQLFVGTIHGLKIFDKHLEIFTDFSTKLLPSEYGVPGAIFVIKEIGDALWIGSSKGLHCLDFRKHIFKKYSIPGLQSDVFAISEIQFEQTTSEERMIWFEIPYLGAYRYDLLKHTVADIPNALQEHTRGDAGVHTLFIDSKHQLWISSQRFGISSYDLQQEVFNIKSAKSDDIPILLGMAEASDHTIWFTGGSGVWFIEPGQNSIQEAKPITAYLEENKLATFTGSPNVDNEGNIWFVAGWNDRINDAVVCFDPASAVIRHFDATTNKALGRIGHMEGITISATGRCIVYGDKGFAFAQLVASETMAQPDFEVVKTSQHCYDVVEGNHDQFWLSLQTGIALYDLSSRRMVSFNYHNSTVGGTRGPSITYSVESNRLFIGQMDYLSVLNLNESIIPECGAPVLAELSIREKKLNRLPLSGEVIKLHHRQNSFVFSFTNFSYTDSELNTYNFRLHPDEPWLAASGNQLTLNSLGYGDYLLEVTTANAFGVPANEVFTMDIHIAPPFVRTWWFSALLVTLMAMGIYILYRYRVAHLQKLNQIRLDIARELHDDMGGNLSQVKILSELEAARQDSHPLFEKINAKLGLIMENMSEIVWSINPQKDDLTEIILHIQQYAVEMLELRNIILRFKIDPIPNHYRLNIEKRRHFYLLFKEAINNIAKYAMANNVNFELRISEGKMQVLISDDGIGFDASLITQGNGLRNMKERAIMLGGALKITTSSDGTSILLTMTMHKRFFL
jgi:signal transduction histidine kinase/ligand-binding sensor domain-containing protein